MVNYVESGNGLTSKAIPKWESFHPPIPGCFL